MVLTALKIYFLHSVVTVVGIVVVSVGCNVVVVQPISSSGQSFTPLHHKVSLMQVSLVAQRIVPSSQGLQIHSHVDVTILRNPFKKQQLKPIFVLY